MVIWRGISPYNPYFHLGDNMTEFKSAWDIIQDLHNLLYNTEKSDNEIYNEVFETSKIFAETFLITPEDFARSFMALRTEIQNEKVI